MVRNFIQITTTSKLYVVGGMSMEIENDLVVPKILPKVLTCKRRKWMYKNMKTIEGFTVGL